MDFNVIDYLAYHADVAVPLLFLWLLFQHIINFLWHRPIKTRFLILFLPYSFLYKFVVDNPLYSYFGSPFSGLLSFFTI